MHPHPFWLVIVLSVWAGCASPSSREDAAEPSSPAAPAATSVASGPPDPDQAKRGEEVFTKHCPICHLGRPSPDRPFIGKNLRGVLKDATPEREAEVRKVIREGNDRMPGYQYNVPPAQIEDLVAYLKTYN